MVSNYASGRKHAKHRYILAVNLPDTFRCPNRQIATKKYNVICLSSMCYLKRKNSNTKYNLRTVFLRLAPIKSGCLYKLLISQGAILNFQWMMSFAERSYRFPKWLLKMIALLTLILQCVHIKRNFFTLYQEEYFLYTMSLLVCYRNFKAVVQRYSWIR